MHVLLLPAALSAPDYLPRRALLGVALGPPDVIAALRRVAAGDPIVVRFRRNDRDQTVRGTAAGRPSEVWPDAEVHDEQRSTRESGVRSVMIRPKAVSRPPVVFLVQGYTCGSIEGPDGTLQRLKTKFNPQVRQTPPDWLQKHRGEVAQR